MPINKTIPEELKAVDFAINDMTARIKTMIGSSDGVSAKREEMREYIQCFQSIKSRLKIQEARSNVQQPRLF
jgi:hypothetical protein